MVKILREFDGHSGSKTFLRQEKDKLYVRKYFNIERNLERYKILSSLVKVPKIYDVSDDYYDMEYIQNIDIKNYLMREDINVFIDFLLNVISIFELNSIDKDYTEIYEKKFDLIDWTEICFNKRQFINKLPKILPQSHYHGDFTLDNILYDIKYKSFVLIDPLTTEYDSFVFDLAKMNQDLTCEWFVRQEKHTFASKLQKIYESIQKKYKIIDNKYLTILMLLRILPYCKTQFDKTFILTKVNKLWT